MKFLSDILAKAGLVVDGVVTLNSVANATTDTDRFIVLDSGVVKFRTGAQILSDIGGQAALTNPVTGTGASGQVAYWTGTNTQAGSNNLFWDAANSRLGIGTNSAPRRLTVEIASGNLLAMFRNRGTTSGDPAEFVFQHSFNGTDNTANMLALGTAPAGRQGFFWVNGSDRIRLHSDGRIGFVDLSPATTAILGSKVSIAGNVSIGSTYYSSAAPTNGLIVEGSVILGATTDAGFRLDVNGTGRFVNRLTVDADIYFTNFATTGIVITGPNVVYPLINIGSQNTTSGNTNIIVGQGNQGTGSAYVLGISNIANSNGAVTIGQGNQANSSGQFTILIGGSNTTSHSVGTFTGTFAIGNANTLAHQASAIMGSNQTTTASNQLIIAATQSNVNTAGFNDIYFGTGPRSKNTNLLGSNITINGSGAGAGTDLSGGNVTIAGGKGTGAGAAGSVIISTAVVGASGTTLQSLAERARFNASGLTLAVITAATTDTDRFLVSDGGTVKYRTGAEVLSDIGGTALASTFKTDYDFNITGLRNSTNKVFTLVDNFVAGTTRVFVNGIRLTPGASYDYVETGTNQITFTNAPDLGDLITVDYIKL